MIFKPTTRKVMIQRIRDMKHVIESDLNSQTSLFLKAYLVGRDVEEIKCLIYNCFDNDKITVNQFVLINKWFHKYHMFIINQLKEQDREEVR